MTDRIDPKAIASARAMLMRDAADTIDALVREMHARELHHFEVAQDRDALVAVVEKVRGVIGAEIGWESPAILIDRIQWALSTSPADALAEHDARLIEKVLNDLWTEIHVQRFSAYSYAADIPGVVKTNTNTFYAGVVRARSVVDSARARLIREGDKK